MGGENSQCTRLPASGKDALISGMEPRPVVRMLLFLVALQSLPIVTEKSKAVSFATQEHR